MLEKTLRLLEAFPPGAYAENDAACFDEDEIEELGKVLNRLVWAPSKLRRRIEELGATITRADFYSEIPTVAELERSAAAPSGLRLDACFRDRAYLRDFLTELIPYARDFAPPENAGSELEFGWNNVSFSYSDAAVYYAMIRRFKPATIVELGGGASTLVASLACRDNGGGRVLVVEPYAGVHAARLPNVELVSLRAQDLDPAFFEDLLRDGDFVFIDTTHTVKHDSDCLHIYLRLLPRIRRDLYVHVHDVFLPGPFPITFMRDLQIYWTEQYLLYAYLLENARTRTLYGSVHHMERNPDLLDALMAGRYAPGGVSFWFHQARSAPPPCRCNAERSAAR